MSHRHQQNSTSKDKKSRFIPAKGESDFEKIRNASEPVNESAVETQSVENSEPEKNGYSFDWIKTQVNKYLESSKEFIKENSVEAATAAAATAGLAAWAALHTRATNGTQKTSSRSLTAKAKSRGKSAKKSASPRGSKARSKSKGKK